MAFVMLFPVVKKCVSNVQEGKINVYTNIYNIYIYTFIMQYYNILLFKKWGSSVGSEIETCPSHIIKRKSEKSKLQATVPHFTIYVKSKGPAFF